MSIHLELIENGHILWFKVESGWTNQEIAAAKVNTARVYTEAQHTLHALVDLRQAKVSLPLITASYQVIGGDLLPNAGLTAVIGVSGMMQMLAKPILAVADTDHTISFHDSFEGAQAYLRKVIAREASTK